MINTCLNSNSHETQGPAYPVIRRGFVPLMLLLISLTMTCWFFGRWTWKDFCVPVSYAIDSVSTMANCKAFSEGASFWKTEVIRLNAPFSAVWDDFPLTEKSVYFFYGIQLRYLPPGAAENSMIWLALASAVLGSYAAARWSGAPQLPSATVALLFGFSHYMTFRASGHLNLAYAWHVPLILSLIHRLFISAKLSRCDWLLGLGIGFVSATLNPYYGFFFVFLMSLSFLVFLIRRDWNKVHFILAAAFVWAISFRLNIASYFISSEKIGPNPMAIVRVLSDLDRWALRLTDLIWPVSHPIELWNRLAASYYYGAGVTVDEHASNFLGLVGLFALAFMLIHTFHRMATRRHQEVSSEAWCALFAVVYSLRGGINYVLGSFGFMLLRATNRYSIFILSASLLFMARYWLPKFRTKTMVIICAGLLIIQFWELSASSRRKIGGDMESNRADITNDRDFGARLEAALPQQAMVFQLPVMEFPESHPINLMTDYSHFRPYIWTKHLRYSYGASKGRVREAWQKKTEILPAPEMIKTLEHMGFDAVFINRLGYPDEAAKLEADIISAGAHPLVESQDHHFAAFRLNPAKSKTLPFAEPALTYGRGFYLPFMGPSSNSVRMTSGNAQLILQRGDMEPPLIDLYVRIHSEQPRKITVSSGRQTYWSDHIEAGQETLVRWLMEPSKPVTIIDISTDAPVSVLPQAGSYLRGFSVELLSCRRFTSNVQIGNGFHEWDTLPGGWRISWAWKPTGSEIIVPPAAENSPRQLHFSVVSPADMKLEIRLDDQELWRGIVPSSTVTPIYVEIPFKTDISHVFLNTDSVPLLASKNDPRMIAYAITDLTLSPQQ